MTFPYFFHVFGLTIHPHPVMELIGYTGGSQLYFFLRRRLKRESAVPIEPNLWLLVGCIFGALVGAKLLAAAESSSEVYTAISAGDWAALVSGKTIVGGLLGGWIGVEIAKRCVGVHQSTGDLFVFPLIFGIAAGRVGCFLTGLADHTYGNPANVPWAVDFGDGVPRHPTQLYEIGFLFLLGIALAAWKLRGAPQARIMTHLPGSITAPPDIAGASSFSPESRWIDSPGALFRCFLGGYLVFRFAVEWIKPTDKAFVGLSAIQWACLVGATACAAQLIHGTAKPQRRSVDAP